MSFPSSRPRRLRRTEAIRRLVQETHLNVANFVYPMFISALVDQPTPVPTMPGVSHLPVHASGERARQIFDLGIPAVILFGIPATKDERGDVSLKADGVVQRAIADIKTVCPEVAVITDVCLCEYTSHGHCGVIQDGAVDNDATLDLLARQALSHAQAGADIVAPSDMMDGRVKAIRTALDANSFSETAIMAYSAKYASAFYGPFRDAAGSAPQFGDRRAYQMNPPNGREAIKEIRLDVEEGADIVMVKPALSYLDVIAKARETVDVPLAAYNVSGEYVMAKAAASAGMAEERQLVLEILTSIKRAGADIIISYHAPDVAEWLAVP
jgi:porphobilinogen synthase